MQANDWLRWSVIGGVLLIFFVPLFVANTLFFPFISGKGFAFRILVEIVFALWAILALRDPSVRPKQSWLLYALGAFLVSIGISALLAVNPDKAFWSNFERMEGWISIAHLVAYFTVVFSMFTNEKNWKILWNTTIAVSVIEGGYGLLQLMGMLTINQGGVRVDGTFGNATYLAIYMVFSFFITLLAAHWWARGKSAMSRALLGWYGLAALLQLVMIYHTATRGAQIGLVGGLFLTALIFVFSAKDNPTLRKWGIGVIVGFLVLGGAFVAVRNAPFVQNSQVLSRLAGIATPHSLFAQLSTRSEIWSMALQGVAERPIFGWGQEGFNYVFNKYYDPSLYAQESWFDRAHDEFIDWLIAGGIVALFLYLSLFAIALWYLWRPSNAFTSVERALFTGLLAAYVLNNIVVFDNLLSYILFFTVLAYIAYRANTSSVTPPPSMPATPVSEGAQSIAIPAVVIAMAVVFYFVNVPGITTASSLIQGLSSHPEGITANLEYFKKAVASAGSSGMGLQEVREQLVQFALQVKSLNAGDAAFQQKVAQYAADQMQEQVKATPNDARIRVFFGSYLRQFGQNDAARVQLLAAHDLSPHKQAILFELGALELSTGNAAQAMIWLKEAYDLAPTFDTARLTYAAGAIRTGDKALASSLLMPRYNSVTPDDDTILNAYVSIKDYPSIIAILTARVAKSPDSYQAHVQLGAGYLESGNRAGAIAELKKAIALNPSFAAQGQSYIDAINAGKI